MKCKHTLSLVCSIIIIATNREPLTFARIEYNVHCSMQTDTYHRYDDSIDLVCAAREALSTHYIFISLSTLMHVRFCHSNDCFQTVA